MKSRLLCLLLVASILSGCFHYRHFCEKGDDAKSRYNGVFFGSVEEAETREDDSLELRADHWHWFALMGFRPWDESEPVEAGTMMRDIRSVDSTLRWRFYLRTERTLLHVVMENGIDLIPLVVFFRPLFFNFRSLEVRGWPGLPGARRPAARTP